MRKVLIFVISLMASLSLQAVPAKPGIGLVGDEHYHYYTDSVHPVIPYAEHARRMQAAPRRMEQFASGFPTKGEVRTVVLLVSFKDVPFITPKEAFVRQLNEPNYRENGCSGSAYDYFTECSMGEFKPRFDVFGPYTLNEEMAYYGGNSGGGNDKNVDQMIIEACQKAEADGVDFSQYDLNKDGSIDNVFVFYAGYNEAEGAPQETVWPHRSVIYPSRTISGKKLYDYACTSELTGVRGTTMCGIGTFCHEFSHVLGLPDLYNTGTESTYTVGDWDLMASGSYNGNGRTPPSYSAFERFMTHWIVPEQISESRDYTLEPMVTSGKAYLLCPTTHSLNADYPTPNEWWMIENRQPVGGDAAKEALPGYGLLISHITYEHGRYSTNTFNNTTPLGYDICEANNIKPSKSSASDVFPGTMNIMQFAPQTNKGQTLDSLTLRGIRYVDAHTITFHLGDNDPNALHFEPAELPLIHTYVLDQKYDYHIEQALLTELHAQDTLYYVANTSRHFEISIDSLTWAKDTIWFSTTIDESIRQPLYIRYLGRQQCNSIRGTLTAGPKNRIMLAQISILGLAERPILIDTVRTLPAGEIGPYNFTCRWEEQPDAERYFLTLHQIFNEPGEDKQGFEQFGTEDEIRAEGWTANFLSRSSSIRGEGKYAILMNQAGNQLESPVYQSYLTSMQCWISQNYSTIGGGNNGTLLIEARRDDGTWDTLERLTVSPTTRAGIHTYPLDTTRHYCQIRFTNYKNNGTGGIIIDDYIAQLHQRIEVIYSGEQFPIEAPASEYAFSALQPGALYCYQLRCMEEKGCTRHYSPLSLPMYVQLQEVGDKVDKQIILDRVDSEHMTVYLKKPAPADTYVTVFDTAGRLYIHIPLVEGAIKTELDLSRLVPGQIYSVALHGRNIKGKGRAISFHL